MPHKSKNGNHSNYKVVSEKLRQCFLRGIDAETINGSLAINDSHYISHPMAKPTN